MRIKTAANRFIHTSVARYYQQLVSSGLGYNELGRLLTEQARQALAFRQVEALGDAAQILVNIPLKHYQSIGHYYLGWALYKNKKIDEAKIEFEQALSAPDTYKARSLISLGTLEAIRGDVESELRYYLESMKASQSLSTRLEAARGIALLKAREGFHQSSLKDLEDMSALVFKSEPIDLFLYLNSLAVELGEAGRINEARNVCNLVLASPFAIAYPECRETAEELKGSNRSFAVLDPSPPRRSKLLSMPVVEHAKPVIQHRPARVINLESWKARMGKKKNGDECLEDLDGRELLLRLMDLGTSTEMTDEKLYKVVTLMESLLSESDEPENPDDDNTGA